jgi:hypothetical protein
MGTTVLAEIAGRRRTAPLKHTTERVGQQQRRPRRAPYRLSFDSSRKRIPSLRTGKSHRMPPIGRGCTPRSSGPGPWRAAGASQKKSRSEYRNTAKPTAISSPSTTEAAAVAARSRNVGQPQTPVHALQRSNDLEDSTLTYLTMAPEPAPPQRDQGRRDLFLCADVAPATPSSPGHQNLDKLGPKLPADKRSTVFPTS